MPIDEEIDEELWDKDYEEETTTDDDNNEVSIEDLEEDYHGEDAAVFEIRYQV